MASEVVRPAEVDIQRPLGQAMTATGWGLRVQQAVDDFTGYVLGRLGKQETEELISKGIDIVGEDNILLDPDCGLRRAPMDVAFKKLKLMNDIKNHYM